MTGSSPAAESGRLVFMVGGEREQFERIAPALDVMGSRSVYAGGVGQGQAVKLVNNAVAATNAATLAQALLVARKLGADLDALVEVLLNGSGKSTMADLKATPMRRHDYSTLFKSDHMLKDVRLCLQAAAVAGIEFPFAAETETLLAETSALGHGDDDFAALLEALERRTGTRL